VGRVHKSKNADFKEGQFVTGYFDWAEYTLLGGSTSRTAEVLENPYIVPWSAFVGVLGMPGFTAYSSYSLRNYQLTLVG